MSWPKRVIESLGREPRVGDWCAPCCILDLHQLDEVGLAQVKELMEDIDAGERFWATKEEALAELGGPTRE